MKKNRVTRQCVRGRRYQRKIPRGKWGREVGRWTDRDYGNKLCDYRMEIPEQGRASAKVLVGQ